MFVIVGLGNPGREYAKTRHNVGFMTIDKIAERLNISVNKINYAFFLFLFHKITSKIVWQNNI